MDVYLLVYDLSQGLARQLSQNLLGFHLDAVYHTSIELNNREYVYDGGIVSIMPGSSHLGRPLERIFLGKTELPTDVVEEYLDSLRPIFTLQAYDLFKHNCNNFSDALSKFLLGKGIPAHIVDLPQKVLSSPMGAMLFSQLTQSVNSGRQNGSILGIGSTGQATPPAFAPTQAHKAHKVHSIVTLDDLSSFLGRASKSCAVIFFTSPTCPPCRAISPLYESLAEEVGTRGLLGKADISIAREAAARFDVAATPTFVTFLKGEQQQRWSGADPAELGGNIRLLAQMAEPPRHPHASLHVPTFGDATSAPFIHFSKAPPMQKLLAKLGETAKHAMIQELRRFIETRASQGPIDATIPALGGLAGFIQESLKTLPKDALFALVDIFRCSLTDPRISGYFAEHPDAISAVISTVTGSDDTPYALRLVVLQMACNLSSTPLFADTTLQAAPFRSQLSRLISSSLLDTQHTPTRVAAASLVINTALADRRAREAQAHPLQQSHSLKHEPFLQDEDQAELAASVVEAVCHESESPEALRALLAALGHLLFLREREGELSELLGAVEARESVKKKRDEKVADGMAGLVGEVESLLAALEG